MLRIGAAAGTGNSRTLSLEGRVIGPWVDELGRTCQEILATGAPLTLDLREVAFVDRDGLALLRGLVDRGASVVNCSAFVCEQLRALSRC